MPDPLPASFPPYATPHARSRMAERFGVSPPEWQWAAAILDILDGRAVLVQRRQDGREVYLLRIGESIALAVYEPDSAMILTVKTGHHHTRGPNAEAFQQARRERRCRHVSRALVRAWAEDEARV